MRIKKGECLNCGAQLNEGDRFCSNCGQKVDNNDIRISAVISEFFENYIALDTSLGRSLIPFFFKPGYLPRQFMLGVRRNFVNPFRLYIFTSIFFFFCLNSIVQGDRSSVSMVLQDKQAVLNDFSELSVADQETLNKSLQRSTIEDLNDSSFNSFNEAFESLPKLQQKKVISLLSEKGLDVIDLDTDSILADNSVEFTFNDDVDGVMIDFDFAEIDEYKYNPAYTNEMLYDTLTKGRTLTGVQEMIYRRAIKLYRADQSTLSRHILGNLSLAMFVLIPLFAVFLKLFYWRRNRYYVAHLIHTIYLQSFAFMIFGIGLLSGIVFDLESRTLVGILQILSLIFAIYFIASFKRIYQQSWFKLLFKSFILLGIYNFLSAIVFLGEIAVSAMLF